MSRAARPKRWWGWVVVAGLACGAAGVVWMGWPAFAPVAQGENTHALGEFAHAVAALAYHPRNHWLAVGSDDASITLWQCADDSAQPVGSLRGHAAKVTALAVGPDGRRLASADAEGVVCIWDVDTPTPTPTPTPLRLTGHTDCVHALAFAPNGARVYSCGQDRSVRVWPGQRDTDTQLAPLYTARTPVLALAVSPDGSTLALAGLDATLWLVDSHTGACLAELVGHRDCVYSLCFSPDGRRLISGSQDGTVRIWDWRMRRELACWSGHRDAILQLACNAAGTRVASVGTSGLVVLWDADNGQPLSSQRLPGQGLCVQFAPTGDELAVGTAKPGCYRLRLSERFR